jgi:hypothetical protein
MSYGTALYPELPTALLSKTQIHLGFVMFVEEDNKKEIWMQANSQSSLWQKWHGSYLTVY